MLYCELLIFVMPSVGDLAVAFLATVSRCIMVYGDYSKRLFTAQFSLCTVNKPLCHCFPVGLAVV